MLEVYSVVLVSCTLVSDWNINIFWIKLYYNIALLVCVSLFKEKMINSRPQYLVLIMKLQVIELPRPSDRTSLQCDRNYTPQPRRGFLHFISNPWENPTPYLEIMFSSIFRCTGLFLPAPVAARRFVRGRWTQSDRNMMYWP